VAVMAAVIEASRKAMTNLRMSSTPLMRPAPGRGVEDLNKTRQNCQAAYLTRGAQTDTVSPEVEVWLLPSGRGSWTGSSY
jgi:hypothetical protein